ERAREILKPMIEDAISPEKMKSMIEEASSPEKMKSMIEEATSPEKMKPMIEEATRTVVEALLFALAHHTEADADKDLLARIGRILGMRQKGAEPATGPERGEEQK